VFNVVWKGDGHWGVRQLCGLKKTAPALRQWITRFEETGGMGMIAQAFPACWSALRHLTDILS